jgi:CheY-like chemotaxis protein
MKSRVIKKRKRQPAKRAPPHNRERSGFLLISHDIRQPLHALGLFVAQLRSLTHEVELKHIVEQIDTAVSTLNERFSEVFDPFEAGDAASTPNGGKGIDNSPTLASISSDPANGKLVAVIDDDPLVIESTCGLLRNWGCTVVTGDSGGSALAALVKLQRLPDLIISDFRLLRGETGTDAIAQLHSAFNATIPALLVSGDTGPEPLHEARTSGFALLHKPVDPMKLRAVLTRILKKSELTQDR